MVIWDLARLAGVAALIGSVWAAMKNHPVWCFVLFLVAMTAGGAIPGGTAHY